MNATYRRGPHGYDSPPLPLPNPQDWMSVNAAAQLLHVGKPHVYRMIRDGLLTGYPVAGSNIILLWATEVQDLAAARLRAGRPARPGP